VISIDIQTFHHTYGLNILLGDGNNVWVQAHTLAKWDDHLRKLMLVFHGKEHLSRHNDSVLYAARKKHFHRSGLNASVKSTEPSIGSLANQLN